MVKLHRLSLQLAPKELFKDLFASLLKVELFLRKNDDEMFLGNKNLQFQQRMLTNSSLLLEISIHNQCQLEIRIRSA